MPPEYRCEITGNPVGTDTWAVRSDGTLAGCKCEVCQWYVEMMKPCDCGHRRDEHAHSPSDVFRYCGANTCRCTYFREKK